MAETSVSLETWKCLRISDLPLGATVGHSQVPLCVALRVSLAFLVDDYSNLDPADLIANF